MISLYHVGKSYDGVRVLKDVTLTLPEHGLVMIYGPSGSGKSTLLHIMSLLLKGDGDVQYDGKSFIEASDDEVSEFRLRNIGLAFQDFKLFEGDTVLNNVMLPLTTLNNENKEQNEQEALTCLSLCGIRNFAKSTVSTLSGGERQRVAIARAMVNKARYIFADEPTGSLDKENTINIMSLLQNISLSRLVVVVSHDRTLIDQFADRVIYLEDGVVTDDACFDRAQKEIEYVQTAKRYAEKKPSLPVSFIYKHIRKIDKSKKWRSRFSKGVISLGLIGVGLSFIISDAVSAIVVDSYSQLIDKDQIIVDSNSYSSALPYKEALSEEECESLMEAYPDIIYDVGATYLFDAEQFYPDDQFIGIYPDEGRIKAVGTMDIYLINDFIWLDVYPPSEPVWPEMPAELEDDEVVARFTSETLNSLCLALGIGNDRTHLSRDLSEYMEDNEVNFDIYVRNDNWNYYDTYRIRLAGFTLGNSNAFYHYNHKWNTVIYSDLYYDFSEYVGEEHETPWTMEEIHYLECLDNAEEVYELSLHDETFSNAFLDKGSSDYFYNFENYDYDEEIYSNRLLAFCNTYEYLSPNTASEIIENEPNITSVVYGNDMGYALYGSYFMTGFAREMYFSFNYDSIMEVDNYLSAYNLESGTDFNPDSSVLKGHYTQVASTGVVFSPLDEEEIYMGRPPNDIGEVAISTAFLDAVELDYEKALNLEELCVLYDYEDNYLANNSVRKDFKEDVLHVVGIIESDQIAIYQDSDWLISYFMFTYDVSSFSLVPYSLAFNIKDVNKMDETIEALEEYLPGYTVYNPVSQLSESVREVSDYISLGILIISVVALIASALLIFAMINILIIENKRDFGLLRCIGVNSKQSFKMVVGYGLYLSISSFILSVIELIVVVLVLSFTTSSISFGMSFFTSLIWMALIAVIVSLVACALQYRKITRLDPLEAIKR